MYYSSSDESRLFVVDWMQLKYNIRAMVSTGLCQNWSIIYSWLLKYLISAIILSTPADPFSRQAAGRILHSAAAG
jgi:hypothetical protein